ncbi:hypothetical protein NDU88_005503 [Pleurodeles waltl]|uniref:Uncharacterized protein n=1 Tax=Pleurodeles waltl TaxID=8319 RepID=A0AAV7SLT5_PLEWA|nr:hypothetical protein NDU88_005503 [Pleurodeles waltl]
MLPGSPCCPGGTPSVSDPVQGTIFLWLQTAATTQTSVSEAVHSTRRLVTQGEGASGPSEICPVAHGAPYVMYLEDQAPPHKFVRRFWTCQLRMVGGNTKHRVLPLFKETGKVLITR